MQNDFEAASDLKFCEPCNSGTYGPQPGLAKCFQCPAGTVCNVGSSQPGITMENNFTTSQQPIPYKIDTHKIQQTQSYIGIFTSLVLFILIIIIFTSKRIYKAINRIDIYNKLHNYKEEFLRSRKTFTGGVFSFLFAFLAIILIALSLNQFYNNNIIETKTLIPLLVLLESYQNIVADFQFTLTYHQYGGQCVANSNQNETSWEDCVSSLQVDSDILKNQKSSSLKQSQHSEVKCKKSLNSCQIKLTCSTCSITKNTILSFQSFEQNSFASGIEINVTSTSSIPNEYSTVIMQITTFQGIIFRGPTPTTMNVIGIPSVFESNYQDKYDGQTGFHFTSKGEIQQGSIFSTQEVQITQGLRTNIKIDVLESGMKTTRVLRYSFLDFCQTLIGSIIGIMVSIGGVMQIFEILFWQYKNNIKNKTQMRDELVQFYNFIKCQVTTEIIKKNPKLKNYDFWKTRKQKVHTLRKEQSKVHAEQSFQFIKEIQVGSQSLNQSQQTFYIQKNVEDEIQKKKKNKNPKNDYQLYNIESQEGQRHLLSLSNDEQSELDKIHKQELSLENEKKYPN